MNFSHYTTAATITPRAMDQSDAAMKPRGLWVSVDGPDDWPTWCKAESYGLGPNRFKIEIGEGPLVLTTADEVRAFGAEFMDEEYKMIMDWSKVAAKWPGLIIAPYQWACRYEPGTAWYYGWDCASGCIWDPAVITAVERCGP